MNFTREDLLHIAKLSALELSDSELESVSKDVEQILEYIAQLSQISADGISPTSHVHGSTNFFRDDIATPSLPLEEVEVNAPDFAHGGFRIPRVI
jgi:aspartyl-tRNA(Asn)/glutamyl-tRNA(Gln) amidotransferase subunit C